VPYEPMRSASVISAIAACYPQPPTADRSSAKTGAMRFWDALSEGANLPCKVPVTRWDIDSVYAPDMEPRKM